MDKKKRRLKVLKMICGIVSLFLLVLLLLFGVTACCVSTRIGAVPEEDYTGLFNYGEEGFFNEEPMHRYTPPKNEVPFARLIGRSAHAPVEALPVFRLKREDFPERPEEFAVYWLGHNATIFELGGRRFLTDPVFGNAAPVPWVLQRYVESPLDRDELPELDFILLTHDHYDHLEYATIRAFRKGTVPFVVPLGVGAILQGWGVAPERIHELNWGDSIEIAGLTVTAETARHFSGRSFGSRNRTLWCSYVIEGQGKKIFFGGDSGYGRHFKSIGGKHGPFDLVCLEVDAWNERWPNTHMFPGEVPRAFEELGGKYLLPVHWGVFDMSMHPWDESIRELTGMAEEKKLPLLTPVMGQKLVPGETETVRWYLSDRSPAAGFAVVEK